MLTPKQITAALPSLEAVSAALSSLETLSAALPSLETLPAALPSLERRGWGWLILAVLAALTVLPSYAQPDSLLLRDYTFVKTSDPWLTHPNAAGLTRLTAATIANADLALTYGGGQLTEFSGSSKVLDVTASAEAFFRLSPRLVFFGAISYDNWTGCDMTGSAFTHLSPLNSQFSPLTSHLSPLNSQFSPLNSQFSPLTSRYPFDIVEDFLANAGRKHRDTYHLSGSVAYTVSDGFAVGARLDYTAANYAKYKDLRHQTKLSDLTATAGLYLSPLSWLSAGAHYAYHRQTESVQFSMNGKSERVYKSLIDYGAFMGLVEQFGNEGYTDKSREMPLFEDGHGGGAQVEVRPGEAWRLFGSLSLAHATGYYGRKSPYTITYTSHERNTLTLAGRLTFTPTQGASMFCLDARYATEHLKNSANTFRALTNDNGATYYEYYDPAETGDKRWRDLSLDCTMHLGLRGELPCWTVAAGYHRSWRGITAYLYPYYRQQQLTTHDIVASCTHHMLLRKGVLALTVCGALRTGSGAPYTDGAFITPAGQQESPATMEAFLSRDYHLLTCRQYSLGAQGRYSFRFPSTSLCTYVRGAVTYRWATHRANSSDGRDYTVATIAIGCTF